MKRGARVFADRITQCLAKFAQVETRSNARGERLGLGTRSPGETRSDQDMPPRDG
jgi:hypothetical protein